MILLQETIKYRVDTEEEAVAAIEDAKAQAAANGYEVKKSSYTAKTKKSKGEIICSWYVVEICKKYNDEQMA